MRILLLLLALWTSAPSATHIQATTATVEQIAPAGLPSRPAPPRTLRAHWHVFVAFALAWALLFGYALSLGRRFARLDRDLQLIHGDRSG